MGIVKHFAIAVGISASLSTTAAHAVVADALAVINWNTLSVTTLSGSPVINYSGGGLPGALAGVTDETSAFASGGIFDNDGPSFGGTGISSTSAGSVGYAEAGTVPLPTGNVSTAAFSSPVYAFAETGSGGSADSLAERTFGFNVVSGSGLLLIEVDAEVSANLFSAPGLLDQASAFAELGVELAPGGSLPASVFQYTGLEALFTNQNTGSASQTGTLTLALNVNAGDLGTFYGLTGANVHASPVPVPAPLFMLGGALGLLALKRRRHG